MSINWFLILGGAAGIALLLVLLLVCAGLAVWLIHRARSKRA
jgi:hypothetical protein